ncbi:C39 family peptidase [Candidatus Uhrbacteria bacterium]|nr:C39 family peptidase [Candidatus Uhrbacteria bacterium]
MVHIPSASVARRAAVTAAALMLCACNKRDAEAMDTSPDDADDEIGSGAEGDRSRSRGRISYGFNGVPYLGQWAAPWGQLRYGDDASCSQYREGGCGPTAFAMVLRYLGRNTSPDDVGAIAAMSGARRCPGGTDGTNVEFLREVADRYRVDATWIERDHRRVRNLLRQRQPVIAVGRCQGFTARGQSRSYPSHFIVLTGVDVIRHRGTRQIVVRVNDPGNPNDPSRDPSRAGIAYMTTSQFHQMHRFLHLTSDTPERPAVAFDTDATPVASARCDQSVLRNWRRFAESDALTDDAWITYGRSIAACDPRGRPWEALGAGDREGFLDEYIVPFVNGDAVRGSPFQRHEPRRYANMVRAWDIEG